MPVRIRSSRLLLSIALLAALLMGGAGCAAPPAADAPTSREIRAVWLTNVDSDVLFSPDSIRAGLDYLKARGFNVVFPVVWNKGFTLYPSDVMARYFGEAYRQDSVFVRVGFDPLDVVIKEAHARGMTVIPWFEFGFASSFEANGGHLLARYPEWAARDREGRLLKKNGFEWMNGLHPDVQDFMLALVREVIEGYEVDGIQGDDRLPAMPSEGGYSAYSRQLYADEHGGAPPPDNPRDSAFLQWKADKLSDFGGRLYTMVKAHDPNLIVSLSPSIYPWSKEEYLQDWPEWIRRGQVDWLHPQNYRYEIERYRTTLDETMEYFGETPGHERVLMAPGILIKAGSRFNGPDYVREALRYNREVGTQGEAFFFYEGLRHQNQHLGDTLRDTYYREAASVPSRVP